MTAFYMLFIKLICRGYTATVDSLLKEKKKQNKTALVQIIIYLLFRITDLD